MVSDRIERFLDRAMPHMHPASNIFLTQDGFESFDG